MIPKKQWTVEAKNYLDRFSTRDSQAIQREVLKQYSNKQVITYKTVTQVALNLGYDFASFYCT